MSDIDITTTRLLLRHWRPEDRAAFAAINADPIAMEFLPQPLAGRDSGALADRIERHFDEHGFGFWAVEAPGTAAFIGMVGLAWVSFPAPFAPAVEIGWRVSPKFWGRGYATEAASAALAYGFDTLRLDEIVAFTTVTNVRSRAVMERIGMTRDTSQDFEHPMLPPEHPLRPHVLYRIKKP
jgi:RimJ/RimL family protein N-acetyltransferase